MQLRNLWLLKVDEGKDKSLVDQNTKNCCVITNINRTYTMALPKVAHALVNITHIAQHVEITYNF